MDGRGPARQRAATIRDKADHDVLRGDDRVTCFDKPGRDVLPNGGRAGKGQARMTRDTHWNQVYTARREREVSWFEPLPAVSLQMLDAAGMTRHSCVVDIGGGESHLVDALLARGLTCLAVLDVSGVALARARERLGEKASVPLWIEADVTTGWTLKPMDLWHDRAVFHFLTDPADRERYRERLLATLKPGGSAIIATFAPDGPEKCSGLPVQRYSPEELRSVMGEAFELVEARPHVHLTPWGAAQSFQYSRLRRVG